jgi:hypothetical protein
MLNLPLESGSGARSLTLSETQEKQQMLRVGLG